MGLLGSSEFSRKRITDLQLPLFVICIFLSHRFIRYNSATGTKTSHSLSDIIRRIDVLGCLLLAAWIGFALTAISLVTNSTTGYPSWTSPIVIGLFAGAITTFVLLLIWEIRVVSYPVIPIELLHKRTPIAVAINNLALSAISFGLVSWEESIRDSQQALHRTAVLHYSAIHESFGRWETHDPQCPFEHRRLVGKRLHRSSDRTILLDDLFGWDCGSYFIGSARHLDTSDS